MSASDDEGFTLLETLVGLAIFVFAFAAMVRAATDGMRHAARADVTRRATRVGQVLLAAWSVEAGRAVGRREGVESGMAWTLDETPYRPAFAPRAKLAAGTIRVYAGRTPGGRAVVTFTEIKASAP
ncbi:MAG: type II secretion system protein [Hyphomicrobiales bacterium]|nr:type II secretion system GspH family protein [Hyphomicrobiales bacterium]MDE2016817.1 type II secretion system protein [Hyphomicrobiales bacterium]